MPLLLLILLDGFLIWKIGLDQSAFSGWCMLFFASTYYRRHVVQGVIRPGILADNYAPILCDSDSWHRSGQVHQLVCLALGFAVVDNLN